MTSENQFCTFSVDGLLFGVEISRVQEVIRYQQMTPVPLAPAVVRGLINLRGQIVTAIDLRRALGLSERPAGHLPMNVVVRTDDGVVSLLADEIGDVLHLDAELYEPPPETLSSEARQLITGVFKLKERLLLLLDTEKTVEAGATRAVAEVNR
jgi:purine-binding chemotaxis protein CheW